jgi:glycosyltransferase involved in cell wall biosynthesis
MTARRYSRVLKVVDGSAPGAALEAVAAADLFLFTSQVECAPLVILEAMAAGTPWVSYPVGNVEELPGGIVARSSRELQLAASEILDGAHPALGVAGREAWQRGHRWELIVDRYESLFSELLSARPSAQPR